MMKRRLFDIGKIVGTHGTKGEVKVYRMTDFASRFHPGHSVYLVKEDLVQNLKIKNHRLHKQLDLLLFAGYENIDDVEKFTGAYLKIDESQLTELKENEYYYHEIIDCNVYTVENQWIGKISEVLAPGANDVFVVKQADDKEVLIPNIKDVIKTIDVHTKKVVIHPMEGLLD